MPVEFRGGLTCSCVALSLPFVEADMLKRGLLKSHIDIYQLGYRTDVYDSKGTHAKGGCTDVGQYQTGYISVWRWWGWTMQRRDLNGVGVHAHGWPYKCQHLSDAAQRQETDWDNKDAGLVGSAQVVGPWPVLPWRDAFRRGVMSLLSDLTDEIATKVAAKLKADLPAAVWNWDGIPNVWGDQAVNPTVRPKNAVGEIGKDVGALVDDFAQVLSGGQG
jgi:hypothetical protein